MKSWYRDLNVYFKTVFWTVLIILAVSISLIPLLFFNLMEIPLGILTGGAFGALYYLIIGFNQKPDYSRKTMIIDVIILITRFTLFAGAMFGLAWLYYKSNIHVINIFAFAGAYLVSMLIYLIVVGKENKK